MATDHELARQALSGRAGAAETLLLRHSPALLQEARALTWRVLGNAVDADDALQAFYERICRQNYRALARWNGLIDPSQECIEPYFRTILRNIVMDLAREARRRRQIEFDDEQLEDLPDTGPDHAESLAEEQERQAMRHCIGTALDDRQRRLVQLHLEGCDHGQIAREMGVQPGNSRIILHRALEALRRCVEAWGRNDRPGAYVQE